MMGRKHNTHSGDFKWSNSLCAENSFGRHMEDKDLQIIAGLRSLHFILWITISHCMVLMRRCQEYKQTIMGKHEEQNKSMRAGIQNRSYDHHPDIKLVLCGIKRRGRMQQILCLNSHWHSVIGQLYREMDNLSSVSWRGPQPCSISENVVYRLLLAGSLRVLKIQIPVFYFS